MLNNISGLFILLRLRPLNPKWVGPFMNEAGTFLKIKFPVLVSLFKPCAISTITCDKSLDILIPLLREDFTLIPKKGRL